MVVCFLSSVPTYKIILDLSSMKFSLWVKGLTLPSVMRNILIVRLTQDGITEFDNGFARILTMNNLTEEIQAYKKMRGELEAKHTGKWVLIQDQKLVAVYDSFEEAAEEAVRLFGAGPYLIRQVGAPAIILPASVMCRVGRA